VKKVIGMMHCTVSGVKVRIMKLIFTGNKSENNKIPRKGKFNTEQTPEFQGPRGMSIDTIKKVDSSGIDNSLASEDPPQE
jgi:hypothetical protein